MIMKKTVAKRIRVAGDIESDHDLMSVYRESGFADNIREVIKINRPLKIIETGTYLGMGTTTVIASSLKEFNIEEALFYSIEINPDFYKQATHNLSENGLIEYVQLLRGVSVPRKLLPGREEIEKMCVTDIEFNDIFIDHKEDERVELYYRETNFSDAPDDLLLRCLKEFDFKPDFVLLDSAGHMGCIEFDYLIKHLKGDCFIALDDIYHIKHHRSFLKIKEDPRFTILAASKEKFGFCIAGFTF